MIQDARFGWRQLRQTPTFTLTAVLSLALGIGASVTMVSAFRAVFLRSLPYAYADRIVTVNAESVAGIEFLRKYARSFDGVAGFSFFQSATLSGVADPTNLWVREISPELFNLLGAKALLGRTFLPSDFRSDAPQTVVLAYDVWRKQFHGDPAIIGRAIFLNQQSHVVLGVMPKGFDFPKAGTAAWLPGRKTVSDPATAYLEIVARLRADVSLESARVEITRLEPALLASTHRYKSNLKLTVDKVVNSDTDEYRRGFRLLLGATGFLILLACLNVASLLLSRAAARRSEFAVRSALGAPRMRLIRQVLAESLVLAGLSGLVGIALANAGDHILIWLLPPYLDIPRLQNTQMDFAVLGFAVLLTFLVAILFGLAPALGLSGTKLIEADRQRRSAGAQSGTLNTLLVGEIAVALILFAGSILMARGFLRLANVNPGFRTTHILTATIPPGQAVHLTRPALTQRYSQLLNIAQNVPGIQAAALTGYLPLGQIHVSLLVHMLDVSPDEVGIDYHAVSPDYFAVMGIPLLQGRLLDKTNGVVINQSMAQKYWPGKNSIGHLIDKMPIIGIVGNTRARWLGVPMPEFYESYQQYLGPAVGTSLVLRTYADPRSVAVSLRQAIHRFDPNQVVENERTLQSVVEESIATPRFYTILLGIFALLALALTLVGVYGVASYGASLRTREFGIRMAVGAERSQLVAMIIRQGLLRALIGITAGSFGAWALSRLMAGLVYGVSPKDPVSLTIAAAVLLTGALMAHYFPARRSTKIDPAAVLRQE